MKIKFLLSLFFSLGVAMLASAQTPQAFHEDTVAINGTQLYVKTVGQGEPLLLINGGPGLSHDYLLPHVLPLADKHMLILYDQRASGRSSIILDSAGMRLHNFVEDIEGLRKHFGIKKLNIVGHSWGGLLVSLYAARYPKRVKSVVLWDCMPLSAHFRDVMLENQKSSLSDEERANQVKIARSNEFKSGDPNELKRFYRSVFKSSVFIQKKVYKLDFYFNEAYRQQQYLIGFLSPDLKDYDFFPLLKKIKVPVLIFHGSYDPMPVENAEWMHEKLKKSELVILQECGHFPFLEKPDELFAKMEQFYAKLNAKK
ncbi:MAG: alpha/beta fold hydrolase [Saprospiraceae bacterium]|nr:alpha/beta fold hydrolase [Saprospiraceae bacterium]